VEAFIEHLNRAGLGWALLMIGCSGGEPPTTPRPDTPIAAPILAGLSLDPVVVWRNGGTFRVTATVAGASAPSLQAIHLELLSVYSLIPPSQPHPVQRLLQNGQPVTRVVLVDDGTGGDPAAGDGVFTSAPVRPIEENPPPLASFYPLFVPSIRYEFADTTIVIELAQGERLRAEMLDADPETIAVPPTVQIGPDVRRAPHVIAMVMPPAEPGFLFKSRELRDITKRYYQDFGYDPDFLLTYQPRVQQLGGAAAFYSGARSDVSGIGIDEYNLSATFGSAGRLQGAVSFQGGPNPNGHGLAVHEILHGWAAYLDPALGIASGGHWAPILDREFHGFTGGKYNDLELYLMGLVPTDSVTPRRLGTNGVTLDDLIARHGTRLPAWPDAQSDFTLATVYVYPRLLTPEELALFDFVAAEFGQERVHPLRTNPAIRTFFEATGGRARMTTRIPDTASR
jgi:hypothetical protein